MNVLQKIKQCVNARLVDCPQFPVHVDKMTEQEYKIAEVAFHAVGALRFIQSMLEDEVTMGEEVVEEDVEEDDEPYIQYSSDGKGNWWKTIWEEQCPEFVGVIGKILKNGRDYRCQGVKGHKGVHWRYGAAGWFEWDDNDDDPKEDGACGSTPPDHKTYPTPKKMLKHHWLSHKTTTKVEDPDKIAQLERGEYEANASVDKPVDFNEMDPELREEIQDRMGIRKAEDRLFIITDPEGNDDNTLVIICSDPRNARSEIGGQDHGGMPYEDWERVLDKGEMKQIKSTEDLPDFLYHVMPFFGSDSDARVFEYEAYTCLEWCQMMGEEGVIRTDILRKKLFF